MEVLGQLRSRMEETSNKLMMSESNQQHDIQMSQVDEKISIASRKISDLNLAYNGLLQPIPKEVKFVEKNHASADIPSEVKPVKEILVSGKAWQKEHQTQYQNEELWIDLRNDWIKALNETSDSSIEDLK